MQASVFDANMAPRSHLNVKREVLIPTNEAVAKQSKETVYLIDDDLGAREALSELLAAFDVRVISFESAADYFGHRKPEEPGCLIIDMQLQRDEPSSHLHQQSA
jgi:response regulator RpfG family c-di-GMP phosphodiesterase